MVSCLQNVCEFVYTMQSRTGNLLCRSTRKVFAKISELRHTLYNAWVGGVGERHGMNGRCGTDVCANNRAVRTTTLHVTDLTQTEPANGIGKDTVGLAQYWPILHYTDVVGETLIKVTHANIFAVYYRNPVGVEWFNDTSHTCLAVCRFAITRRFNLFCFYFICDLKACNFFINVLITITEYFFNYTKMYFNPKRFILPRSGFRLHNFFSLSM